MIFKERSSSFLPSVKQSKPNTSSHVESNHRLSNFSIIIWQGSLEVNPSVLVGSYLVGILPYGPFPRLYIFVLESRQIQNKQVWPECHIINYLLASLAQAELGNIGYRSFVWISLCSVRTANTWGPIIPSTALALG